MNELERVQSINKIPPTQLDIVRSMKNAVFDITGELDYEYLERECMGKRFLSMLIDFGKNIKILPHEFTGITVDRYYYHESEDFKLCKNRFMFVWSITSIASECFSSSSFMFSVLMLLCIRLCLSCQDST